MNPGSVYAFDSQAAFHIPDDPLRFEAFSNFLRTTRELGADFSLIGQEMGLQPQIRFRVVLEGKSQLLDPLVYEHAYRIGREALLNAFRHSQASRIELRLACTAKELSLTIRDNGQGMSPDSVYMGCNGLSWMKTMAERISATLRLLSRARAGTEVFLSIPGEIAFLRKTKPHWQAAVA
jgi:signal transduction histidine kinase